MKQISIDNFFKITRIRSNNKRRHPNDEPSINDSIQTPPFVTAEILLPLQNVREQETNRKEHDAEKNVPMDFEYSSELINDSDSSSLECNVSPDTVNFVRTSTPIKKVKRSEGKETKVEADICFILHTIEQYETYLKTFDVYKGILKDESLALLSNGGLESQENELICSLYCNQYEPKGIADGIKEINYTSLYEKGFVTFFPSDADVWTYKQCIDRLIPSQLKAVCDKFKLNTFFKNKRSYKEIIATLMTSRDISEFTNNSAVNKKIEVLRDLRSRIKKWNLSDRAFETITELIVLMHLDSVGCSIESTKMYNDRPEIKIKCKASVNKTKTYPVDKTMIVDNATIIFQDRMEFCKYLEALAFFEKYNSVNDKDKREIVLRTYQLYKDVTAENMSRYRALPPWLRRFTPADIYVEILNDGLKHLKKLKKCESETLAILDLLITQMAFQQDKKADWYELKVDVQQKRLKSPEKAAGTLCEALDAVLPEEYVSTLWRRAKLITDIKTRNQIDIKVLEALKAYADREILERTIPDPRFFYQEPIQKSHSRQRPQYKWKGAIVRAEILCCNIYKEDGQFTLAEHWEGMLMNTIYFLLFWDIIYKKPLAIAGIFMSHYQQYPLDMWCESFYINRKAIIDDFLIMLQNSTIEDIINLITSRYDELVQYNVPEMAQKVNSKANITTVVRCLGPRALVAICRRLAHNYKYWRTGFPDLTLCNTNNHNIEFREVKTNTDTAKLKQLQWLQYLNEHNIKAGFCYLTNKKEQCMNTGHSPDTINIEEPQPGTSTNFV